MRTMIDMLTDRISTLRTVNRRIFWSVIRTVFWRVIRRVILRVNHQHVDRFESRPFEQFLLTIIRTVVFLFTQFFDTLTNGKSTFRTVFSDSCSNSWMPFYSIINDMKSWPTEIRSFEQIFGQLFELLYFFLLNNRNFDRWRFDHSNNCISFYITQLFDSLINVVWLVDLSNSSLNSCKNSFWNSRFSFFSIVEQFESRPFEQFFEQLYFFPLSNQWSIHTLTALDSTIRSDFWTIVFLSNQLFNMFPDWESAFRTVYQTILEQFF